MAPYCHGDYLGKKATVEGCFLLIGPWQQTQQPINIGDSVFDLVRSEVIYGRLLELKV
jgi:hypothetical protein